MEHSLEDLIAMYDESVTIAKNEKRRQKDILKKIVNNFCEHRVGQKATFEKDGRSHTIVCCNINPDIFHGSVIYTGMIDELFDYELGELPYRSVRMSFETVKQESYQEAATVNYPNNYTFTRITEFKKIHPVDTRCTTILKEYPQPYVKGENTPYYPIFTEEKRAMYAKYQEKAKNVPHLTLLGRLAEYRYYDMDDIVKAALERAAER